MYRLAHLSSEEKQMVSDLTINLINSLLSVHAYHGNAQAMY